MAKRKDKSEEDHPCNPCSDRAGAPGRRRRTAFPDMPRLRRNARPAGRRIVLPLPLLRPQVREGSGDVRVVVGMATCGIAAGARPVLSTFVEEVNRLGLSDKVTVSQTGCIGICQYEPVVEVFEAGKEKVTYVKMTPEKAKEVVEAHLQGGKVLSEYTISNDEL